MPSEPPLIVALTGAACNLFISAAGAGLLSYPFAVQQQGIVLNVALTLVFAVLNGYTDCVLAAAAARVHKHMHMRTFEELCLRDLGPRAYAWAVASVIIGCIGSLVGFLVIIGDMAVDVAGDVCGEGPVCAVVASRAFLVLAFALVVALPLSSCDRIHAMWGSSLLAAVTVLAVGVLVVRKGASSFLDTHTHPPTPVNASLALPGMRMLTDPHTLTSPADVAACRSDNGPLYLARGHVGLFLGMPISVFSLGNHIQAVVVFAELPRKAQAMWHRVVSVAVGLCVVLYLCTGVFGYLACRDGTAGDILKNFSSSDPLADSAKALMAIHIAMAMPVIVLPCRRAFRLLWHFLRARRRQAAADADREHLLGSSTGMDVSPAQKAVNAQEAEVASLALAVSEESGNARVCLGATCSLSIFAQNALMILVASAAAILFPQVQVVFGLLGATVAVSQIYVFPALMLWKDAAVRAARNDVSSPRSASHSSSFVAASAFSAEALEEDHLPPVSYTPSSPFWLRVHAGALMAVATVVALVGTGTFIWSSFISS